MNVRKTMLAVGFATMGMAGMSHAGSLSGEGSIAEADLVFAAPASITNTLTATENLEAGKVEANKVVATGLVKGENVPTGTEYAVGFNSGEFKNENGNPGAVIYGQSDSEHTLSLALYVTKGDLSSDTDTIDGKKYLIGEADGGADFKYEVLVDGESSIPADTYTVSTVAYIYNK
ncbi:hypothetical protein ACVCGZ_05550 [Serratia nematodiphila]